MRTAPGRACADAAVAGAAVVREADAERGSSGFRIRYKGPVDLVTEVDRRAEEVVIAALRRDFPEVPILAEERGRIAGARADRRFLVDPLDGTTNFAHGFPVFAVSVAYEERGAVVAGAVADPVREELFTAEAGAGAERNGEPISVTAATDLQRALLATGFPYSREAMERALRRFTAMMRRARAVRRAGSAALDLCWLAAGRLDGFWEEGLRAWDTAAGELMVREAGGRVTDFAGNRFENGGPSLAATNGGIHEELLRLLAETDGA